MSVTVRFCGAAHTVTGSCYLVETPSGRFLIDCGLFQGYKQLRLRNWAPPPIAAASVEAVILTHAHIDHSGYLPRLAAEGFRGPIYCTRATMQLAEIVLTDSAKLGSIASTHADDVPPATVEMEPRRCTRCARPTT